MKAIKRTVAGLLATLMFASCFSFNFAFGADNYTDEEAIAVSKVNAADIMTGTDNGFEPSKTLTRAEAAAIVVRMKGVPDSQVQGAKGTTIFTDVPASSWAAGYINAASTMGIISGVGNGLFLPEREVSIVEFAAMAIRALDAGKLVDSIGTWPTNYVNFATEERLFDGVIKAYTAPATRMDVAFMVVNTIEAEMWGKTEVTNTNEVTYKKTGKTLLKDVLDITVLESGKLANNGTLKINTIDTKDRKVTFTPANFNRFDVAEGVELATLKADMEVDVWAKEDDKLIIRIVPAEKAKVTKVEFNGIKKIDLTNGKEKITLSVDGEEEDYTFDPNNLKVSYNTLTKPTTIVNKVAAEPTYGTTLFVKDAGDANVYNPTTDSAIFAHDSFFGTAILDGNKVTDIYAERYENRGVVKEVKNGNIYFENSKVKEDNWSSKLDLDNDELEYVVTKNGKEFDVNDIEKGDALYFYKDEDNSNRYVMVVNNYSVTGTAKQVSADKYVKVDGKKYELAIPSVDIAAGSEVKLYLNAADKVTMYEIIDGAVDSTVALVKSLRKTAANYVGGAEDLEIVLVQLDGTELDAKVVDLKETYEKLKGKYFDDDNNDYFAAATDGNSDVVDVEDAIYNADMVAHFFVDGDQDTNCDVCSQALATCKKSIVGTMVRYTLKGGKVVIREFYDKANKQMALSFDKQEIETFEVEKYTEENGRLGSKYRLNDNTTIFVVKAASGDAEKYSVKFEKVDFEDLGTTSNLSGYVLSKDENTNIVKAVLFTSQPSRATNKNYAIVLDTCDYNGSEEDYSEELTLLLNDGTVTEVIVPDRITTTFTTEKLIEAFIKDNKLDDVTELGNDLAVDATAENKYRVANINVISFNGDGTVRALVGKTHNFVDEVTNGTTTQTADNKCDLCDAAKAQGYTSGVNANCVMVAGDDTNLDIAENCMYVMKETDGEFVKGSEGKVPTISSNDAYSVKEEIEVKAYFVYNTETKTQEIVALVYNED